MKKILLAFVFVAVSALAQSAPSVSLSVPKGWMEDVAKARAKAALQGKFVLMAFSGSDWCGWCVRMENEVFSQNDFVNKASKKFVLVMLDNPRDKSKLSELAASQNQEMAQQYRIGGYPSVVITDAKGEEVNRHSGYVRGGPKAFLERLDELIADVKLPTFVLGANQMEGGDLVPLFIYRVGECTGELEIDDSLEISRRAVKSLNAKDCDMGAIRTTLDKMADELNALIAGAGGNPSTHLRAVDELFKQYAKEAKLPKEELLETQIRFFFRLSKGFQTPGLRKAAETKLAVLKRQTKNAEDYVASEELRLLPAGMPLDGICSWAVPKKLAVAVSEGQLSEKGFRLLQAEVLKTARKVQGAKGAVANAATMSAACETAADAKKFLPKLDAAVASCERLSTTGLGNFFYSASEKTDAKIRILEGHVDLLKAIAAQIGNKAAAVVNARIAAIETTAKSVGRNRQADIAARPGQ